MDVAPRRSQHTEGDLALAHVTGELDLDTAHPTAARALTAHNRSHDAATASPMPGGCRAKAA